LKIRQVRLDRWGALSGLFALDEGRLSLLVVDTARELDHLASGFDAILSRRSSSDGDGLLEAELELDEEGARPAYRWWRCEGTAGTRHFGTASELAVGSATSDTPPDRKAVLSSVERLPELRSLVHARRGEPCVLSWDDVLATGEPKTLVAWLRRNIDSVDGTTSLEDVRAALLRGLASFPGTRVKRGSVDREIELLSEELGKLGTQAGSLNEDRRSASRAVGRLLEIRRLIDVLEPPLKELERYDNRTRLMQLTDRLMIHRDAHRRVKDLSREVLQLGDLSRFPDEQDVSSLIRDLRTWASAEIRLREMVDDLVESKESLARCRASQQRRAWVARVSGPVIQQIEAVAQDLKGETERLHELKSSMELDLSKSPDHAQRARKFAALDRKVGATTDQDRQFALGALGQTLASLSSYVSQEQAIKNAKATLASVIAYHWRIYVGSALVGLAGLGLALGFPVMHWSDSDITNAHCFIGGGMFLLFLSVGTWTSAGGFLSQRRSKLEAKVASLAMPLELEGLRLSTIALRIDEICRRLGYSTAEELACDLTDHVQLRNLPDVQPYRRMEEAFERTKTERLAPLLSRAQRLLSGLPPAPLTDPLAALEWILKERKVHELGDGVERELASQVQSRSQACSQLASIQKSRLTELKERLARAEISALPENGVDAVVIALATRQESHSRWLTIRDQLLPAESSKLMSPIELGQTCREVRRLTGDLENALGLPAGGLSRQSSHCDEAAFPPIGGDAMEFQVEQDQLRRGVVNRVTEQLAIGRRRLSALYEQLASVSVEAEKALLAYHTRLPTLLEQCSRLREARERAVTYRDALSLALARLDQEGSSERGSVADRLNQQAITRLLTHRPGLEGIRFASDLDIVIPKGHTVKPQDWQLLSVSVRASLSSRFGPDAKGFPLTLVEPLPGGSTEELADLVAFLTGQICPDRQVLILTRKRSRYETVRFGQPTLFKRIQVVEAARLLADRGRRPRVLPRPLLAAVGRQA